MAFIDPRITLQPKRDVQPGAKKVQIILSIVFIIAVVGLMVVTAFGTFGDVPRVKVDKTAAELISSGADLSKFNCECKSRSVPLSEFLFIDTGFDLCDGLTLAQATTCYNINIVVQNAVGKSKLRSTTVMSDDSLYDFVYDLIESSVISGLDTDLNGAYSTKDMLDRLLDTHISTVTSKSDALLEMDDFLSEIGSLDIWDLVGKLEQGISYDLGLYYDSCDPHNCFDLVKQSGFTLFLQLMGVVAGQAALLRILFTFILDKADRRDGSGSGVKPFPEDQEMESKAPKATA